MALSKIEYWECSRPSPELEIGISDFGDCRGRLAADLVLLVGLPLDQPIPVHAHQVHGEIADIFLARPNPLEAVGKTGFKFNDSMDAVRGDFHGDGPQVDSQSAMGQKATCNKRL